MRVRASRMRVRVEKGLLSRMRVTGEGSQG